MITYTRIDSPVGELVLTAVDGKLASVSMSGTVDPDWQLAAFDKEKQQLAEYFAGTRTVFELELATAGTDFQRRVWDEIDRIPYGKTISYGDLTDRLGLPRERVRAVAAAIGANPLLVVRPCHRVIGADGSLTGYAGGLDRKEFLLTHEGVLQPQLELS
ncbi:methylated-DNA--[protein]-cysteine S-methyltransferase [Fodinicola acaciae]|uniref:methylated-DNA--[protein]-cysteine S-methyltransferase n=1 Tax=Fodinicola acaciae TaxID=2681555 RepID=UPI0013CFE6A7|nr:methylated-DNA--[protein]-cysteine S-methyltransferase [Fodinicola acaciae]